MIPPKEMVMIMSVFKMGMSVGLVTHMEAKVDHLTVNAILCVTVIKVTLVEAKIETQFGILNNTMVTKQIVNFAEQKFTIQLIAPRREGITLEIYVCNLAIVQQLFMIKKIVD